MLASILRESRNTKAVLLQVLRDGAAPSWAAEAISSGDVTPRDELVNLLLQLEDGADGYAGLKGRLSVARARHRAARSCASGGPAATAGPASDLVPPSTSTSTSGNGSDNSRRRRRQSLSLLELEWAEKHGAAQADAFLGKLREAGYEDNCQWIDQGGENPMLYAAANYGEAPDVVKRILRELRCAASKRRWQREEPVIDDTSIIIAFMNA